MPGKAAPGLEAVLKQPAEQRFFLRKCNHAVADITGRKNAVSRRSLPELPPSSVTVTTAVSSLMGRWEFGCSSLRRTTYSLRPRSKVDSPVPPPRATTRKPRDSVFVFFAFFFTELPTEPRFQPTFGANCLPTWFSWTNSGQPYLTRGDPSESPAIQRFGSAALHKNSSQEHSASGAVFFRI